ncbi:hypothetical protein CA54_39110 [Symmachiella macrocystis]|uniref:Uncharacterized protein n=1 Tax=Symmachiella macrocystis TaxID=2527985 RepID=A0A5C6B8T1_9PLAN|nr:hypothetical protein CA54_39110 [Symmachiella macrocystis]
MNSFAIQSSGAWITLRDNHQTRVMGVAFVLNLKSEAHR